VFVLASFAQKAEAHIIVGTALINMSKLAMISFRTQILHKLLADLDIMAKITLVSVWATPMSLVLITGFYF
jgi:hypothetical protein